ncbi:MAG: type 4a pilus biogenesis protein PilO [Enterobacterales bacterium]|nr:type 4a pilus biogenesis protein PilO [Enterobacterales bacterium]
MDMNSLNEIDINDIDFSNMGSWPAAGKAVMAALVFFLVIAVGYWMVIGTELDDLATIERKEIDFKRDFEKKQAKAVNLEAYKRQMQTIKDSFQTLLQQLPKADQMAELLDEISYAATGAGCELMSANFDKDKDADFYTEKPIQIQVTGGYHQLADFVSRVSRLPRIVTLHDFTITIGDSDLSSSPGEKMLIMNITAKTYRADSGEK